MMWLEIVLFILGTAFIIISFFVVDNSEKTRNSSTVARSAFDADAEEKARAGFVERTTQEADFILHETEDKLETLSNEKIIAVGEYSDQVIEKINTNHKEVVFLYQMLNDKAEELKDTVARLDNTRIECEKLLKSDAVAETKRAVEYGRNAFEDEEEPPRKLSANDVNVNKLKSLAEASRMEEYSDDDYRRAFTEYRNEEYNDEEDELISYVSDRFSSQAYNPYEGMSEEDSIFYAAMAEYMDEEAGELLETGQGADKKTDSAPEAAAVPQSSASKAALTGQDTAAETAPAVQETVSKTASAELKNSSSKTASSASGNTASKTALSASGNTASKTASAATQRTVSKTSAASGRSAASGAASSVRGTASAKTSGTAASTAKTAARSSVSKAAETKSVRKQVQKASGLDTGSLNKNDEIIALYKSGKSVMEISKLLGMGQGEVKLIINLYC